MNNSPRHEFRFIIEGIELSPEQKQQLSRAVQEAGLSAIAAWDLGGDRVAAISAIGGGLSGKAVKYLAPEVAKRILGETQTQ